MKTADIPVVERAGSTRECPHCLRSFAYAVLSNHDAPEPFFYCDSCPNILLRRGDGLRVRTALEARGLDDAGVAAIWHAILTGAPPCPCGGTFRFWNNVRCPHCHAEFPYDRGRRDVSLRLHDARIILVSGATVIGDGPADTWEVLVHL